MDVTRYLGVPFLEKGRTSAGLDCWGLVRLVLREQFAVEVPSYAEDYASTHERDEIAALINQASLDWVEVPLASAQAGDVLILRLQGQPWHCGIVIAPPMFLHADRRAGVVMERWDGLLWARRIAGVYRHAEMGISGRVPETVWRDRSPAAPSCPA